jgi:hypothetical protein
MPQISDKKIPSGYLDDDRDDRVGLRRRQR